MGKSGTLPRAEMREWGRRVRTTLRYIYYCCVFVPFGGGGIGTRHYLSRSDCLRGQFLAMAPAQETTDVQKLMAADKKEAEAEAEGASKRPGMERAQGVSWGRGWEHTDRGDASAPPPWSAWPVTAEVEGVWDEGTATPVIVAAPLPQLVCICGCGPGSGSVMRHCYDQVPVITPAPTLGPSACTIACTNAGARCQ